MAISNPTPTQPLLAIQETVEILLAQGYVTSVDLVDADLILDAWKPHKTTHDVYVRRRAGGGEIFMHRVVLSRVLGRELSKRERVDHINNCTLDNRRLNLRLATAQQNNCNRRISKSNTSGFKGVRWVEAMQAWRSEIRINRISHHLGYFDNPEEAHDAYAKAAIEALVNLLD